MKVWRRSSGQALVEFALVFPIFMLLLVALVDFGRGIYAYNTISQAAREGTRLASVQAGYIGASGADCVLAASVGCPANNLVLRARVATAINNMVPMIGQIPNSAPSPNGFTLTCSLVNGSNPSTNCVSSNLHGDQVTVTVTYRFSPIIGQFLAWLVPVGINMSASSTMAII